MAQQLDSTISKAELLTYYELNKENFKTQWRTLETSLHPSNPNFANLNSSWSISSVSTWKTKTDWMNGAFNLNPFSLNDSTWVKRASRAKPPHSVGSWRACVKKNFTQLQDSLGVYLVKSKTYWRATILPRYLYVEPTIRQIILNKRKQELTKKLEKDITKDAIKTILLKFTRNTKWAIFIITFCVVSIRAQQVVIDSTNVIKDVASTLALKR